MVRLKAWQWVVLGACRRSDRRLLINCRWLANPRLGHQLDLGSGGGHIPRVALAVG